MLNIKIYLEDYMSRNLNKKFNKVQWCKIDGPKLTVHAQVPNCVNGK